MTPPRDFARTPTQETSGFPGTGDGIACDLCDATACSQYSVWADVPRPQLLAQTSELRLSSHFLSVPTNIVDSLLVE